MASASTKRVGDPVPAPGLNLTPVLPVEDIWGVSNGMQDLSLYLLCIFLFSEFEM